MGGIDYLDKWLDRGIPAEWQLDPKVYDLVRINKVFEESGEVTEAYIGWKGINPRKGVTHSREDFLNELCDVVVTATLALQHFIKNEDEVMQVLEDRWLYRVEKAKEVYE
jgi:hypothetical protein